ncbi:hypothetical protein ACFPOB_29580 [Bosea eneae]|uniref:Uncharacterized protein n=1 Tax=Bosea eneae TaxID=151454 RepID=A0ABW0IZD6_9HYPH
MSDAEKVVADLRALSMYPGDVHDRAADLIAHQAARLEEVTERAVSAEAQARIWADHFKDAKAALTAAEAEKERLLRATTPSPATKAAYIGEFHFDWTVWDPNGEEQITHRVQVPWTTIKQIMAAIRSRAVLSPKKEQGA